MDDNSMFRGKNGDSGRCEIAGAEKTRVVLVFVLLAGIITVIVLRDPAVSAMFPPCPFHTLTGLHCPGCGSLRAFHQLLHGNIVAALGLNPLMLLSLPFLAYAFASRALGLMRNRRLPAVSLPSWWGWLVLGIILAYWVLRNIPVYPFSALAP